MQSTDIIQPLPLISPIATEGLKNSIPDAATGTNNASIEEGFPEITMQAPANGGLPPFGQDFNGLFYTVSSLNCFLQNGGYITFNQAVSDKIGGYPSGAILDYIDSTGAYSKVQSLIDNNTNNFVTTPSFIDGVNWKQLEVSASALATLANVDLSNISATGQKVIDGQWVLTERYVIANSVSISLAGTTFDISDYLPNDGNDYEILCLFSAKTSAETAMAIFADSSKTRTLGWIATAQDYPMGSSMIVPILNGSRSVHIGGMGSYGGTVDCGLLGYRRLGTND